MSVGGTGLMNVVMQGWSRPLHPTIPPNQNKMLVVSSMTIIADNSLCSTRAYHLRIDLAHDATVGERCMENKNFLRTHNDLSMEMHINEGESVSTYPRRP